MLDQVEGVQHRLMTSAFAPQRAEVRRPVVARDQPSIRKRLDAERGVNNGREAIGPVMAVAREAADTRAIPAHHQAVAVVLDLVDQSGPDRGRATFEGSIITATA